ncbi:hypothetical protein BHU72_11595 [Desulfuribacillus stibiiarsenatis]|uniref:PIN domain-containing protein n=1 Tax=Desulfuribacillus stibiiarsenatis TaxID=1390249 RepID=A0A1E5L7Q6_9FIRM|nr:PhoH family protein [Desulfuribacillus stibiiarsenatis]OEH86175.1 hypothetical protein BHU72_11595 [Desulfuribacillus stibiiarsenatis]
MGKIYVLDTNVLLQDPGALFSFQEHEVVIPAVVIEEVDGKKRLQDELGRSARQVSRQLDRLREQGSLIEGVKLPHGGTIRVELNHKNIDKVKDLFLEINNDNRILAVALNLLLEESCNASPKSVILVSMDAIVRIKADVLGLKAEDYKNEKVVDYHLLYPGFSEFVISNECLNKYYTEKKLVKSELEEDMGESEVALFPNQMVILKNALLPNQSAIVKYNATKQSLEPFQLLREHVWGIYPRNAQQKMALELLLDDNISLVTITGKAGTGKTLISLAAGLYKTEDERKYNKVLVARPIIPFGKDIGFLPGEKQDKLRPWMQPIFDNLELLFNKRQKDIEDIVASINIEVEALTYIRGRSIPNQYIIIDEAQNLSKHEVKTIITRVGANSKIILLGDPEQIDNPYLDSTNNGLTYVVEKFKYEHISGHISLLKGERSELARLASHLL